MSAVVLEYCESFLPPPLSPSDAPGTTAVTETRVVARDNVLILTLALHRTPVDTLALPSSLDPFN